MNVDFFKRVGIICGALIAASTIAGGITGFVWQLATAPIVQAITAERVSRTTADSTIVTKLEGIEGRFRLIGKALTYPPGSMARERALAPLRGPANN
jgi:hypothetical protein